MTYIFNNKTEEAVLIIEAANYMEAISTLRLVSKDASGWSTDEIGEESEDEEEF